MPEESTPRRERKRTVQQMVVVGIIATAIGIAIGLSIHWFPPADSTQADKIDTLWDVLIIATGVDIPASSLSLLSVADASSYHFDLAAPVLIPDTVNASLAVAPGSAYRQGWPEHPHHAELLARPVGLPGAPAPAGSPSTASHRGPHRRSRMDVRNKNV